MPNYNNEAVPLMGYTVPRAINRRLEEDPLVEAAVTVSDLKAHLRITDTAADTYLETLAAAATDIVEKYLSRRLVARDVVMYVDGAPGYGPHNGTFALWDSLITTPVGWADLNLRWIELMGVPVAEFDSFKYVLPDGTEETVDPSTYYVDTKSRDHAARVVLQRGAVWPMNLQVANGFRFYYRLGYQHPPVEEGEEESTASPVPATLRHGVMIAAAALWSNRGDNSDQPADILGMGGLRPLLDPYRIIRI